MSASAAELKLAGIGEARSYLIGLVGDLPANGKVWREILALAKKDGGDPKALCLQGRALSFLGRSGPALEALDLAVTLSPRTAQAWAWRGEARLLAGMFDAAREDLDRAVALDPRWPWGRVLRAVCRLTMGDCDGANKDLSLLAGHPQAKDCALGLRGLLEGQRGAPQKGLRLLDEALAKSPSAFLYAIRGVLRSGALDLDGSVDDLNKAAQDEPTPWVLSQRADVLTRSGFYQKALDDLKVVSRLLPGSAQPHAQSANILFDQAFYPEALGELERALALSPGDPSLIERHSRFCLVLGRLRDAEADLRKAVSLDPRAEQPRFELLQMLALQNRFVEVRQALSRREVRAPFSDYLAGLVDCREGRYAAARAAFSRAAQNADGGFAQRLRFYASVARILSSPAARKTAGVRPQFYLCGIGLRHPYQVTVEILHALNSCEVLYNNLGDPQVSEFLGLFRGRVRAVTRVFGEPAMGRVKRIIADLKPGKATGFVTRIHPFIYRRIAKDLATVCQEKRIRFQAFGAVSLTEIAWALGESADQGVCGGEAAAMGVRVFDMCHLNSHESQLATAYPMVVYCIAGPEHRAALYALLRRRYPAAHAVHLLAGSGDRELDVVPCALKDFERPLLSADPGAVLYVPPVRGGK